MQINTQDTGTFGYKAYLNSRLQICNNSRNFMLKLSVQLQTSCIA